MLLSWYLLLSVLKLNSFFKWLILCLPFLDTHLQMKRKMMLITTDTKTMPTTTHNHRYLRINGMITLFEGFKKETKKSEHFTTRSTSEPLLFSIHRAVDRKEGHSTTSSFFSALTKSWGYFCIKISILRIKQASQ